jgi:3,4-dihydroxy 2-butanone 4-phosphate synthase/GTP cyclohydrolase II
MGVSTIMVEGGAQIITSFLSDHLADQVVVTIAPLLVGGLRAVQAMTGMPQATRAERAIQATNGFSEPHTSSPFPRLMNTYYEKVGNDFVIRGDPDWTGP